MLAVDTNILVRVITNDDPIESPRARQFLSENVVRVGVTVVLESAWVLAKTYGMSRDAIAAALQAFMGLEGVEAEAPSAIGRGLDWARAGMDIADAIHLALAGECEAFVTLDRDLIKRARSLGVAARLP